MREACRHEGRAGGGIEDIIRTAPCVPRRQTGVCRGHPAGPFSLRKSSPMRRATRFLRAAAKTYGWDLNYGEIALMWRGGCIIRSTFLSNIKDAFDNKNPELENLLLDPFFRRMHPKVPGRMETCDREAMLAGIPVPAFASALCYYDGYRCERLPANSFAGPARLFRCPYL